MKCYFQGCKAKGVTKEHIPPRAFFPDGEKNQLLTVRSCENHNNKKSKDDIYVLAHICINSSPKNRAREVFLSKIFPQLGFNNESFRKILIKDSKVDHEGRVSYRVDTSRFDNFFTGLTCGILFKSSGEQMHDNYEIRHIYHNFSSENEEIETRNFYQLLADFYSGQPIEVMDFGKLGTKNETIYTVKIFGVPGYKGSITVVHEFFGHFKVTSMVTFQVSQQKIQEFISSLEEK